MKLPKKRFLLFITLVSVVLLVLVFYPSLSIRDLHRKVIVTSGKIMKEETLYQLLKDEGLPPQEINVLMDVLDPFLDAEKTQAGDWYELIMSTDGIFQSFKYFSGPEDVYRVERSTSGEVLASWEKAALERQVVGLKGVVRNSLWEAMLEQGQTPEMVRRFSNIFAWQIDFLSEVSPGDTFMLIWERYYENKRLIFEGDILAAEYNGRKTGNHRAIFFMNAGAPEYYTLTGESFRRQFLRSPLTYTRISSRYSLSRFHPILRYWRPHKGIDYAAPSGTPVVSIGDGTVLYADWKGSYGRFIEIKHDEVYSSTYGHLSGYARGIRKGARVKQGQVIGYVGASGLATGPHLDFRIKKDGEFVNLLQIKFPVQKQLDPKYWEAFKAKKKEWAIQLAVLSDGYSIIEERRR